MKHQTACARCGQPASMWSGVDEWQDADGAWIGWCSKTCQKAWLNGDKGS